jgi:hypothetical protein
MYRDNEEAAHLRAEALQRQLDESTRELAATKAQLAASEADRRRLDTWIRRMWPWARRADTSNQPLPGPVPRRLDGIAILILLIFTAAGVGKILAR